MEGEHLLAHDVCCPPVFRVSRFARGALSFFSPDGEGVSGEVGPGRPAPSYLLCGITPESSAGVVTDTQAQGRHPNGFVHVHRGCIAEITRGIRKRLGLLCDLRGPCFRFFHSLLCLLHLRLHPGHGGLVDERRRGCGGLHRGRRRRPVTDLLHHLGAADNPEGHESECDQGREGPRPPVLPDPFSHAHFPPGSSKKGDIRKSGKNRTSECTQFLWLCQWMCCQ